LWDAATAPPPAPAGPGQPPGTALPAATKEAIAIVREAARR
jgi:hypothetical protein